MHVLLDKYAISPDSGPLEGSSVTHHMRKTAVILHFADRANYIFFQKLSVNEVDEETKDMEPGQQRQQLRNTTVKSYLEHIMSL